MRSAFRSRWRLFRSHPEIETPGAYVFVPDSTPFYPGFHHLGSRDWTSDERDPWPELGEVQGFVRRWTSGRAESPLPEPLLIGSRDCIHNGERVPRVPLTILLPGGFDSRCPRKSAKIIDITDCHFQQWSISVIQALYSLDAAAVESAARVRFPAAAVSITLPNELATPGMALVQIEGAAILVMTGTTNVLQALSQLLTGIVAPSQYLGFSTLPIWYLGGNAALDKLSDNGVIATDQITFVGHSLGGAAAAVGAALLGRADPTRVIALLTFGAPKVGDQGLVDQLDFCQQANIIAEGDPIPWLPPSDVEALALQFLLAPSVIQFCRMFRPLTSRNLLLNNGNVVTDFVDSGILVFLVREVLRLVRNGYEFTAPYTHTPENYRRLLACEGEPIPVQSFKYLAWGGGAGNGSAGSDRGGGTGNGSAELVQIGAGGGRGNGSASPTTSAALVLWDEFNENPPIDLASHTGFTVNTIGGAWTPAARIIADNGSALVRFAANGVEICTVDTGAEDLVVEALVSPYSWGPFFPVLQAVGVTARANSGGAGWIATLRDTPSFGGLEMRLYDTSGYTSYDQTIPIDVAGSALTLKLTCLGQTVTAECGSYSLSYTSDTYHAGNTLAGIAFEDNPSPFSWHGVFLHDFKVYV